MPRSQRAQVITLSDESDDEDDDGIQTSMGRRNSRKSATQKKMAYLESDDEGSNDDGKLDEDAHDTDDDDEPIQPSSSRGRRAAVPDPESSSDSDLPAKKPKMIQLSSSSSSSSSEAEKTPARRLIRKGQPSSSPTKRQKGHRTPKQKNMELLKRRRAGEKIDQLTSSESDSEADKRGLYDTASDDSLQILEEFPDEEEDDEGEPAEEAVPARKPRKQSLVKKDELSGSNDGSDLSDFVIEDDEAPIGAPAHLSMPYEFTAQARKPPKEQFPFIVEWLVHNKINPAFERKDPIYTHAWQKLDDEVRGLATSKFISSVWKVEFYRSLKARPKLEAYETGNLEVDGAYCEACGRSGHPATWKIQFQGQAYSKDTLEEVESDSDSDESDRASVDTQGNELPSTSKEWAVGSTCCSNAETAHKLMHWKHALKEWVEERLETEGHLKPAKLKEREKMKAKKRRKAANEIVDNWRENGTVTGLYQDFRSVLQEARDKSTSGRGGGSRWK